MDNYRDKPPGGSGAEVDIIDALEAVSVIAKWLAGVLRKLKDKKETAAEQKTQ